MLYNAEILKSTVRVKRKKRQKKSITHDYIVLYSSASGWWCKNVWSFAFKVWQSKLHIHLLDKQPFLFCEDKNYRLGLQKNSTTTLQYSQAFNKWSCLTILKIEQYLGFSLHYRTKGKIFFAFIFYSPITHEIIP